MRIVASFRDVKWNFLGVMATMAFNVITLPLMLLFIDAQKMGIWYIFISISSLAALFDMGFAVTFSRMVAYVYGGATSINGKELTIGNNDSIDYSFMCMVLKICRIIYILISTVVLILLISIGTIYIMYVSNGVDRRLVIIAWGTYLFAIYLNILFGYYTSLLRGTGNITALNQNVFIGRAIQIVLLLIFLFAGFGIIGGALAYLSYNIVFRVLSRMKLKKYEFFNEKNLDFSNEELMKLFFQIWGYAWKEGLIAISMYITNQASTIVCSLFLTLEETAAFSLGTQMAMMISQIAAVYFSSVQPSLQNAYARKDDGILKRNIAASIVFCGSVFLILALTLITVGIPILRLINYKVVLPISILVALLCYYFLLRIRDCSTSYFSSTNRIIYTKAYVFSSILSIILMIIFAGYFDLQAKGIILGQVISQIIFNFWYWPIKCYKELKYPSFNEFARIGCREIIGIYLKNKDLAGGHSDF
jgi:O-antigen/teichoic acid export membrane protein